jgi:hypothetical protein
VAVRESIVQVRQHWLLHASAIKARGHGTTEQQQQQRRRRSGC